MQKTRRPCLLIALLLGLTSCSTFRIAYNYADWYLVRQMSDITCPTDSQRRELQKLVKAFFDWHRRQELPRYARAFRRVAGAVDRGPVTREVLDQAYGVVDVAFSRAARRLKRPLVALGSTLGPKQAGCITRKLTAWHRERLEDLDGSPAAYRVREGTKVIERLEPWTGTLSSKQRDIVVDMLPTQREARAVATARFNKGRRLIGALTSNDAEKKRTWLRLWITDRFSLYSTSEQSLMKRRDARSRADFWRLIRTLDKDQRAHLSGKLRDYAQDFEILSKSR